MEWQQIAVLALTITVPVILRTVVQLARQWARVQITRVTHTDPGDSGDSESSTPDDPTSPLPGEPGGGRTPEP